MKAIAGAVWRKEEYDNKKNRSRTGRRRLRARGLMAQDRSNRAQVHETMRQIGREFVKVAHRRRTRGACAEL